MPYKDRIPEITTSPVQGLSEQAEAQRREIAKFEQWRDACKSPEGKQALEAEAAKVRAQLEATLQKIHRAQEYERVMREASQES